MEQNAEFVWTVYIKHNPSEDSLQTSEDSS